MHRVRVEKLEPGMIVARPIYSNDEKVLLNSGVVLKERFIRRLEELGIASIDIQDELGDYVPLDVISQATRNRAIQILRNSVNQVRLGKTLDLESVESCVSKIIDEVLSNRDILISLTDIRSFDNYTYGHCVNVAILSLVCGISVGLTPLELRELTLGAILHDIGKLRIPEEILNKPGRLTKEEYQSVIKHASIGYELVKNISKFPRRSAWVVYQHHERMNGSGYPQKLVGRQIDLLARIAAIADVYDAITADRIYQKGVLPAEAIHVLKSLGSYQFDPELLAHFVKNIALYPVGSKVFLSDGTSGVVVDVNKRYPARPIVRVLYDGKGKKLQEQYEVDLIKKEQLEITDSE